ncbi:c6 transcription factor [Fusarium acutatum]|uniref:C6 transcription factor n=1 Tax=Fusarium acutatum TaxID=78861 RepID=A0A8H4JYQ5_9HYPO|nr:c6 transcription factor [Fusarium acutatum]
MASSSQDEVSPAVELNSSQKRVSPGTSKPQKRISSACDPCRYKHIRCDGGTPCTRCKEEGKPCHYTKSRRGIRNPKKTSMKKEEALVTDQDDNTESTPSPDLAGPDIPFPQIIPFTPCSTIHPFDLYYTHFHVAHSWLPPREKLEDLCKTQPENLRFLVATVTYIGSLYLDNVDKTQLQQNAYRMSHDTLSPTVWSVQALLCLSVTAFGRQHVNVGKIIFNKACVLASCLGLQSKEFADRETDPVLAESCRRTYWGLYTHEMLLGLRQNQLYSTLYPPGPSFVVGLPCEDWDYQAGNIPAPITLEEYDRPGLSREYSSWAYFVDLIRIYDIHVAPFLHDCNQAARHNLKYASQLIDSWRFRIKDSKKYRVGEDGMFDVILYHALVVSFGLEIRMQAHLYGHWDEHIAASLLHSVATEHDAPSPVVLQAPLRLMALLGSQLVPEKFSPSCLLDLEQAASPLCHAVLHGAGQPDYRSRFLFLAEFLKKSGEFWPRSKVLSDVFMEALGRGGHEHGYLELSQATSAVGDRPASTTEGESLWLRSPTLEHMGGWSGLPSYSLRCEPETSIVAWAGNLTQAPGGDMTASDMPADTGSSVLNIYLEAGCSGDKSRGGSVPVKVEK